MKAENYTRKLLGLDQNRDWKSFGSARNKYRDAMKIATQNGWRSCSSETEKEVRATRLDKILSRNPQTIFFFKRSNDSITKIKHAYLIEAYFSGFRALTEITNLIWDIKYFNQYKSPDSDVICTVLSQRASKAMIGPLTKITRTRTLGYIPKV